MTFDLNALAIVFILNCLEIDFYTTQNLEMFGMTVNTIRCTSHKIEK